MDIFVLLINIILISYPIGIWTLAFFILKKRGHQKAAIIGSILLLGFIACLYFFIHNPEELISRIIFLGAFYYICSIFVCFPLVIWFIAFLKVKQKGYLKTAIVGSLILLVWIVYSVYTAIYPTDSFYKDEFVHNTDLAFPKSGKVLSKYASYPDFRGKYCSASVFELSSEDYRHLINTVITDKSFISDTDFANCEEYDIATKGIDKKEIVKIVKKNKIHIGFLKDQKRIILERTFY